MMKTTLDKEPPSLTPHGDILKVPGSGKTEGGRPPGKPGTTCSLPYWWMPRTRRLYCRPALRVQFLAAQARQQLHALLHKNPAILSDDGTPAHIHVGAYVCP